MKDKIFSISKSTHPATGRRLSRELAFAFFYGYGPAPSSTEEDTRVCIFVQNDFEHCCAGFETKIDSATKEFAWEIVQGVGKNLPAIDKTIKSLSTHWRIERMPKVDLAILRMAAFEIMARPDIPKTVSINEAIEVAKKFGSEDSAAFINGLLDKIAKPT